MDNKDYRHYFILFYLFINMNVWLLVCFICLQVQKYTANSIENDRLSQNLTHRYFETGLIKVLPYKQNFIQVQKWVGKS